MARHSYKKNPASLVLVNPGKPPKKRKYKPRNQPPPRKYWKGSKKIPARPKTKPGDTVYIGQPITPGPRKKKIEGRPDSGWYWVDSHNRRKKGTSKAAPVRGYLRYFENPSKGKTMAKKRKSTKRRVTRKRPVRTRAITKRRTTKRRKPARATKRRKAIKRRKTARRNPVRRVRRKLARRRPARRRLMKRNPIKRRRRSLKRKPIRRRRAYRNPYGLGEIAKKGAAVGAGLLLARLSGNLVARYGGQLSPSVVMHSVLIGDAVAVAAAMFVPKKVKALAPYRMHLTLGAAAALFLDVVDNYVLPQVPSVAPWIGPSLMGAGAATAALEGSMGEYIGPMGEYVRSPLGEYVATDSEVTQALAGGSLFGNPDDEIEVLDDFDTLDGGSPFDVNIVGMPSAYPSTYRKPYSVSPYAPTLTRPAMRLSQGAPQPVVAIPAQGAASQAHNAGSYGVAGQGQGIFGETVFD